MMEAYSRREEPMRNTILLSMLIAAYPLAAFADEAEAVAALFYVRSKQATKQKIASMELEIPHMEKELRNVKRGVINKLATEATKNKAGGYIFPDADSRKAKVAEIQATIAKHKQALAEARAGNVMFWADFKTPLDIGTVGKINFVLELVQKVDDNSARVSIAGETCFLDGIDLSKAADGTDFRTDVILEVTGTRTYKTVSGAPRTEFVVKPFDMKRVEAIRAKDKR